MESDIQVFEVENNQDLNCFINLPWDLYSNSPNWVSQFKISVKQTLNKTNNPFWLKNDYCLFLAKQNTCIIGRIAAIINYDCKDIGYFGFLESIDNIDVFNKLLCKAEEWVQKHGCKKIIGPVNPSINYELGILESGFDSPSSVMLTYNNPYYGKILRKLDYLKVKDFFSYLILKVNLKIDPKLIRISEKLKNEKKVKVRELNFQKFDKEVDLLNEIYNDGFKNHWGYSPMSINEFRNMAKEFKSIADRKLILIVELDDVPVGFILALPDLNEIFKKIKFGTLLPFGLFKFLYFKNKINRVRVITACIKLKYQPLGLGSLLYLELIKRISNKYSSADLSWVAEDNYQMNKIINLLGGKLNKTWRLYQKSIIN